ncbi:MAG: aminoacyl-histidine dipeptidase [Prevotella sp.]|nr:aminoacyl-histidine dipeptidase [Prevotella sp.]MCI5854802.1 aminoacyl-histidine dipeptidase [Prevotella sp.]MDY6092586.1 aminoacyl-histidine dipeptidase [Prevotella sp.]
MNSIELKPKSVFDHFARINAIPRPSKREEKMIAYLKEWGESHGLDTRVDKVGNVIIRKPATPGYEDRKTVILQSHFDMVCDKLVDVEFDFDRDAIQTYVDGEWLKARGTTLGADDGIGVAIELAILEADDICHGPLECVFTRDEETQLTGASGMEADFMTGDYLINLDSEDEGQIFVSCAGGRTTTATFALTREEAPADYFFMEISVKGLVGGHSGDDIEKKRANAIKLLARFLYQERQLCPLLLASFNSGRMHNAIPRDGKVVFAVPQQEKETLRIHWNIFTSQVEDEFHVSDQAMVFNMESTDRQAVIAQSVGDHIIRALQGIDNGVFTMCQDEALSWMVETSSNVASVVTEDEKMTIVASQRSNVMSNLDNQCNTVKAVFELAGAEVVQNDGYPAWKMNPNSRLTAIVSDTYEELFGHRPEVKGIHAGLECGLFSERYPHLDMVSFGPTLRYVHTPDERLLIPTVDMVWRHLIEILKRL